MCILVVVSGSISSLDVFKKRKIAKNQIFINLGFETRVWLSDQSDLLAFFIPRRNYPLYHLAFFIAGRNYPLYCMAFLITWRKYIWHIFLFFLWFLLDSLLLWLIYHSPLSNVDWAWQMTQEVSFALNKQYKCTV